MSGGQKLSDEALIKLEKRIVGGYDSLRGQVKTLQGIIDNLEGHWRGIGAHAFDKKQTEINERLIHMGKILAKFLDAMNQTRGIKNDTEDQIIADMKSIDPNLGGKTSAISQY